MKPTISVILPFKNEEAFILECLQSFSTQKSDQFQTELILVDDSSTDNGPAIISVFAESQSNIQLVANSGNGIVRALNTGIEFSSGEFISRMDGDDVMPPNKLEVLFSLLQNSADVSTGKVSYFASGKDLGDGFKRYESWLNQLVDTREYFGQIYRECPIASPNWMMSRKAFDSIGGFGDRYPEDYDLVFRMKAAGLIVDGADEVTHLWRDHDLRASRNDPNYLDNSFLQLKCDHFSLTNFSEERPLILIGAGSRGKQIAKHLTSKITSWITNNIQKQGHIISDIKLDSFQDHKFSESNLYISTLSSPDERKEIDGIFSSFELIEGQDYFHFC